jgi:hypothetical protein
VRVAATWSSITTAAAAAVDGDLFHSQSKRRGASISSVSERAHPCRINRVAAFLSHTHMLVGVMVSRTPLLFCVGAYRGEIDLFDRFAMCACLSTATLASERARSHVCGPLFDIPSATVDDLFQSHSLIYERE